MKLPDHKTKIVCTIGPASESPEVLEAMIQAGMDVARLNFSHGDFGGHAKVVAKIRAAARKIGRRVAIFADLPGPKMRIGQLAQEPLELRPGDPFTLTTQEIVGDATRASMSFAQLPGTVKAGNTLYLNDGVIQLEVIQVAGKEVRCKVVAGGELRSKKGLNLPGIDLGISAFTARDRECLGFAKEQGLDAVSQSFVDSERDIASVREAARGMGYDPFIIAKIERSRALGRIDEILGAADAIMIARGDLGVEIPIEEIALVQKRLTYKANLLGKPVITATQMLESMTGNRRPTRAEATDVANAILDGTDCVMLSGESAMGKYPVESAAMLARIASAIETDRPAARAREFLKVQDPDGVTTPTDLIALNVEAALERIGPAAVVVPTMSGATARNIVRFRPGVWTIALSPLDATCQRLQFSWGVHPVHEAEHIRDWNPYVRRWLQDRGVEGRFAVLTEGPSAKNPDSNHRMEIIDLSREGA